MDPLAEACKRGDAQRVKNLIEDGANPAAEASDSFGWAASFGQKEVVELLLKDKRVDPTAKQNEALIAALANGHVETAAFIMERCSNVNPFDNGAEVIWPVLQRNHMGCYWLMVGWLLCKLQNK